MTQKCSFLETVAAAACDYRVPCSTCNVNTCCQRPPPKHPSLWLKSPEYTQSYPAPLNWMKKLGFYIHMEPHSTTHVHLEILGIYSIYYRKRLSTGCTTWIRNDDILRAICSMKQGVSSGPSMYGLWYTLPPCFWYTFWEKKNVYFLQRQTKKLFKSKALPIHKMFVWFWSFAALFWNKKGTYIRHLF